LTSARNGPPSIAAGLTLSNRTRRLLWRLLTAAAVGALMLLPSAAFANGHHLRYVAPPGSAVAQYLEVVPGDSGSSPPRLPGESSGTLAHSQVSVLDHLGPQGRTLAAVVDATAPAQAAAPKHPPRRFEKRDSPATVLTSGTGSGGTGLGSGTGLARGLDATRVGSPASSIFDAATGGGSGPAGFLVPALTLLALLVFAARAIGRRRADS
jgi:hypothetical protein